jgi:hypothetical protein
MMTELRVLSVAALTWLALATGADGAHLEPPGESAPPASIVPLPRPVPANPLTDTIRRLTVRPGHTHRGLTVFPLVMERAQDETAYLSMTEAMDREELVIMEKDHGSVPIVRAENTGKRPILLLAGEIIVGGKQNRTLREDVLLLPGTARIELPVYCVEHGRWRGKESGAEFSTRSSIAATRVRSAAQAGAGQSEVWAGVSTYQQELKTEAPTADLQTVQDSPQLRAALQNYRGAFRSKWPKECVGMVVARYGQIVGADIFCNTRVFRKHRERLLESYAIDCHVQWRMRSAERELHVPAPPTPSPGMARSFLHRALLGTYTWRTPAGAGRLLNVSGVGLTGSGLVFEDSLLHAALFEQVRLLLDRPVDWHRQHRAR